MSRLVLKGHTTRGVAVIQLLVMLGAKSQYTGTFKGFYYWIEDGQVTSSDVPPENSIIFSLEEFLEKYPYKVGDKVLSYNKWVGVIESMEWYRGEVLYHVRERNNCLSSETVEHLQYYIDMSDLNKCGTATIKYIQENGSRDMELIIPYNQEIINIDGRYILRDKKLQCPKTYAECCDIMHIEMNRIIYYEDGLEYRDITRYDINLLTQLRYFRRLLICRDAYWKIAGEQMGLGKPWEYDMSKNEFSCAISYEYGSIQKCEVRYRNHFLVFPTKEMRDEFYKNFNELIEQCKELL